MESLKLDKIKLVAYGLPLLVFLISIVIGLSPILKQHPELAAAIIYDLTLTVPILFLILSRNTNISKLRAIPLFIIGIITATYVLPESGQQHLSYLKTYALPAIELIALGIIALKIRKGIRIVKSQIEPSEDFLAICKKSVEEIFGKSKFALFISFEITMLYYALFSWGKKKLAPNEFTNYRENGNLALMGALLMVIGIETFTFHTLLVKWSSVVAWILTGTSMYTALMIFAQIKALLQSPTVLLGEKLIVQNGLISNIHIHLDEIHTIEVCTEEMKLEDLKIGNLGLSKESTDHTIALYFNTPQTIEKMYGSTEVCDVLLLHIDNRNGFIEKMNNALKKLRH